HHGCLSSQNICRKSFYFFLLGYADQVLEEERADVPVLPVLVGCEGYLGKVGMRVADVSPYKIEFMLFMISSSEYCLSVTSAAPYSAIPIRIYPARSLSMFFLMRPSCFRLSISRIMGLTICCI